MLGRGRGGGLTSGQPQPSNTALKSVSGSEHTDVSG